MDTTVVYKMWVEYDCNVTFCLPCIIYYIIQSHASTGPHQTQDTMFSPVGWKKSSCWVRWRVEDEATHRVAFHCCWMRNHTGMCTSWFSVGHQVLLPLHFLSLQVCSEGVKCLHSHRGGRTGRKKKKRRVCCSNKQVGVIREGAAEDITDTFLKTGEQKVGFTYFFSNICFYSLQ